MEQYLSDQNQLHIFDNNNFSISCKNADLSAVDNFSIISPTPIHNWKPYASVVNLGHLETILVLPKRRQNVAGKLLSTLCNI